MGLKSEDFEVVSDGVARPIEHFSSADQSIALVLLVDVSASNPVPLGVLEKAADQALLQPRIPPDLVRVGGLARQLTLSPRFTTDRAELRRAARVVLAARDADRIGPSPLWDGVQTAVEALELEWRRRAIVMVTDGRATGNVHGMAYVMGHAIAASVLINIVAVPTGMFLPQDGMTAARVRPPALLEEMAGATGGAYAEIGSVGDVAPYLVRSISRLHQMYVLGFPPVVLDGLSHGLGVRVKRAGVRVRAKTGYVADLPRQIPPGPCP